MTSFKDPQPNCICLYLWAYLCPKGTSRLPWPWSLAQESEAIVPNPKGGASVQGSPSISTPQSKEEAILAGMEPLQMNVGDTK